MRPTALAILGVLAAASCGDPGPARGRWERTEELDAERWGVPCGRRGLYEDGRRASYSWSNSQTKAIGEVFIDCNMIVRKRDRSIWRISVRLLGDAEQVSAGVEWYLNNLLLPFVPPEVQLLAREVAYADTDEDLTYRGRALRGFRIYGGFEPSKISFESGRVTSSWSLQIESGRAP